MTLLDRFKQITTLVFDVDGVLTDGSLIILPGGIMARTMNVKDGYALQLAVKKGYKIIVISGGKSEEVKDRLEKLGVVHVYMQVTNKIQLLRNLMEEQQIQASSVLFMGDDIPDMEVMKLAAIACCPADSVNEIRQLSHYISPYNGGHGCGRDVIEKVLKLRGDWNDDTHIPST